MTFADRLEQAVERTGTPALVGLDPHLGELPEEFAAAHDPAASRAEKALAVEEFLAQVVELVAGRVPAVKPQSAFFELLGADGAVAWERTVARARKAGLLVIGDVKRGDIGSTAAAYARAFLSADAGDGRCDAITLNPLLGTDSLAPFLELCSEEDAGVYVLVRTSNPDSAAFQLHGEPPLCDLVAGAVERWGAELVGTSGLSSVGAVVGATHKDELARLRARMPRTPFLIPGYGAQGAGADDVAGGFLPGGRGALVNSSRGVLFAWRRPEYRGRDWKDATREALGRMIDELGRVAGRRG